jgi:hypothetical protein
VVVVMVSAMVANRYHEAMETTVLVHVKAHSSNGCCDFAAIFA